MQQQAWWEPETGPDDGRSMVLVRSEMNFIPPSASRVFSGRHSSETQTQRSQLQFAHHNQQSRCVGELSSIGAGTVDAVLLQASSRHQMFAVIVSSAVAKVTGEIVEKKTSDALFFVQAPNQLV